MAIGWHTGKTQQGIEANRCHKLGCNMRQMAHMYNLTTQMTNVGMSCLFAINAIVNLVSIFS